MRSAFFITTAVYAVLVVVAAATLPARVPLHFGASGQPDRWGSRSEAVLAFGLIGAGLAIVLGGMAALADRLPLRAASVNLPHKQWWTATPEREAEAHRRLRADLYGLAAATMAFLAIVVAQTVVAAHSDRPSLGWPFGVLTGAYILGVLAWSVWMVLVRYRPGEER